MSKFIKMEVVMVVAAWAANSFGNYLPLQGGNGLMSRYSQSANVTADLSARLSPQAKVYLPGDAGFASHVPRWSAFATPDFTITVEVANENDVVETIKYANANKRPFLAVNNAHGGISTVGRVQNGIQINMQRIKGVKIAADGKTATFGAGILAKDVIDGLWAAGKQTVTGGCECVSIVGPGLGGGHGFLQGRYGLISDQFVSLNLVTADGKVLKVDKNHELWWAIQGAGHNFGIVTSITSKIYDNVRPKWAYSQFIFTGDKVEGLYATINDKLLKNGTQDVNVINYSFFTNEASIDPSNPVIIFFILQEDAEVVDAKYTAPFTALKPVVVQNGAGDYRDLPSWTGNGNNDLFCQKTGLAVTRFPIDLQVYNIAAQRKVYDTLNAAMKATPALNGSVILFEGYSTQGVHAVDAASTAYPFRDSQLLVSPVLFYPEGPELNNKAQALGTQLRDIQFKASGLPAIRAYVNYAYGNEGAQQWYGTENWRQQKLKSLKQKYDPTGKFNFYGPIMQSA